MNFFLDYLRTFPILAAILFFLLGWFLNALISFILARRKYVDEETQASLNLAQADLKTARANLDKSTADLNLATTGRAALENDLKLHQKTAADQTLRAKDWEAKHVSVSTELKNGVAELAAAAAGSAALTATIARLTAERDASLKAATDTSKWDIQLKARDAEIADWKVRYAKLEGDHGANLALHTTAQSDLKSRAGELAAALAGGALLQTTISKLTGEKAASLKDLNDARARIALLEADLKTHGDKSMTFESSVKTRDLELADLRAKYAKLEADNNAALAGHAAWEAKHKVLGDQHAALTLSHNKLQHHHDNLTAAHEFAVQAHGTKTAELAAAVMGGAVLQHKMNEAHAARAAAEAALAEAHGRIAMHEAALTAHADNTLKFASDVKFKDTEAADLRARLAKADADAKALAEKHANDLKIEISKTAAAAASGAALSATIGKLSGDRDTSSKALIDANARAAKVEADLKIASDTSKWTAQLTAKDSELSDLRAKLAKLDADAKVTAEVHANDLKAEMAKVAAAAVGGAALTASISAFTGEKEANAKALAVANDRAAQLEADLKPAGDTGKWTNQLNAKDMELADLRGRIGKLEGDVKLAGESSARYNLDLSAKDVALADAKAQLAKVQVDLNTALNAHAGTQNDLKGKATEFAAAVAGGAILQSKLSDVSSKATNSDKALAEAYAQIGSLRAEVNSVQADRDALRTKLAAVHATGAPTLTMQMDSSLPTDLAPPAATATSVASGSPAVAVATLAAVAGAGAALQATTSAATSDKDASTKALADANDRAVKLEADMKFAADTSKWTNQLNAKDMEMADLRARIGKLEGDVKLAGESGAKFNLDLSAKDAALAEAKALHAKAQSDAQAAMDAHTAMQNDLKGKATEFAAAVAGGAILQTKLSELSTKATDGEKALAEAHAQIGSLRAEVNGLQKINLDLSAQEAALAEAKAHHAKTLSEALAALDAHTAMQNDLNGKATEFAAAVAGGAILQTKLSELSTKATDGEKALAEAHAQIGSLRAEVNSLQADRDALKMKLVANPATAAPAVTTTIASQVIAPDQLVSVAPTVVVSAVAYGANKFGATGTADMKAAGVAAKVAANANLPAGVVATVAACPQHLSDVRGIGTVFEARLYSSDIGTYWELANLSDADFRRILNVTDLDLIRVAFADTRADALKLANESNSVGRIWSAIAPDDFEPLGGVGYTYEKRLYDAGICTYQALAAASAEQLEKICIGARKPPKMPDFASWIARAKALIAK